MRLLVTGSRDWENVDLLCNALAKVADGQEVTLVSGACPTGADAMAEALAERMGWTVERHPADWKNFGKSAGYRRNAEMVMLGADVCVAFIRNKSRGATMTADLAGKAGIPLAVYRSNDGGEVHD